MKKIIVLFTIVGIFLNLDLAAQCGTATLDSVCFSTLLSAGGGICKDSLPQGMAGHPYLEDVSFVMPPSVNITVPVTATVTLININITGVGGLPIGLDYACNHPTCVYHPSAGDQLGALRVCGTPITPGLYTLTVYILADVNVSGVGDRYGELQTYTTTLRILPDTSGGVATFNYSPPGTQFCDTTDLTFHATVTSPGNPVKYAWDFGNGHTSTLQNPTIQNYVPSASSYKASLKTTLYAYRLIRVRVISTDGALWSGDAEVYAGWPFSPDFVFKNTSTNRGTSEATNNNTPEWTGLRDTIIPGTDSIGFTLTDIDGSFFGLDPDDIVINDRLPVVLGNVNYIAGSNSIQVEFDTIPYSIFYDTVALQFNPVPTTGITSISDDSICFGDTSLVTVNYGAGYSFQWQKDGVDIPLANDSFLYVKNTGNYTVSIQNTTTGCSTNSTVSTLTTFSRISYVGLSTTSPGKLINTNYPGTDFIVDWYKNGVLIPGEHGVILNLSGAGVYTCHIYNASLPRCGAVSDAVVISAIDEVSSNQTTMQIIPNPSTGIFSLAIDLNEKSDYSIDIVDIAGRNLLHNRLENYSGKYLNQFDLSSFGKGVYFIHVRTSLWVRDAKIMIE